MAGGFSGRIGAERLVGPRPLPLWGKVVAGALGVFAFLLLVTGFVARSYVVSSASMEDTLQVGDRVLVSRLSYAFGGSVHRGDVVVFDGSGSFTSAEDPSGLAGLVRQVADDFGLDDDRFFVKRVLGVGGDRVRCCDAHGRILVNGRPVAEPYLYPGDAASAVPFDIQVPPGELWMMGDHRSDSRDSRDLLGRPGGGFVPVSKVEGRVVAVVWPLSGLRGVAGSASFPPLFSAVALTASGQVLPAGRGRAGKLALWIVRRWRRRFSLVGRKGWPWAGTADQPTMWGRIRRRRVSARAATAPAGVRPRRWVRPSRWPPRRRSAPSAGASRRPRGR